MNLYLISQEVNNDYDTYDSAVVCAETKEEARNTHPSGDPGEWYVRRFMADTWAQTPDQVNVKLIGVADPQTPRGVVLASFNAG